MRKHWYFNVFSFFIWRRHPDLNRGSEFCRLVPYHLAIAPNILFEKNGAGNGAQTRDLCLGKAALYQLSYSRICF